MFLQQLQDTGTTRTFLDTFGGYNCNLKVNDGEWNDENNMSAHEYPLLCTRNKRKKIYELNNPGGMIAKGGLYYVDGSDIVCNGYHVDMGLTAGVKQLVSMGAYLLVWPDKKWLNTENLTEHGNMEHSVTKNVTASLCKSDGTQYGSYSVGDTAPTNPNEGDLWLDTSNVNKVLKQYAKATEMWVTITTVYVKIAATGIGANFKQYDGVNISGFSDNTLNGSFVLYVVSDDYVVITGLVESTVTQSNVTISRDVPDMDYVTECDNRIWGCKYGFVNGKTINEIYACKLGDFKNWNCFQGLSTDSYVASRGADGQFSGAITYLGYPLFFRENMIEKVYPSSTGAHQIVSTPANGVQLGSWRSLQIVDNVLYYKGITDIYAYTGSLPTSVSNNLGDVKYNNARAGSINGVYYISMYGANGWNMFTYDVSKGVWHKEDNTEALMFTTRNGYLYYISNKKIYCADSSVTDYVGTVEDDFDWYVTSGVIGYDEAGEKYISRFVFRADIDGDLKLQIKYDNGQWEDKGEYHLPTIKSFVLPVQPKRCDHLQYRLIGFGSAKIYSIARYYESGSDVAW